MNTQNLRAYLRKTTLVIAGFIFVGWACKSSAQDANPATVPAQLPDATAQVIQLEQAHVSDNAIIAYLNNSGAAYNLNASQIIYLKQQGVSDTVLTAMLTQPKTAIPAADTSDADTSESATASSSIVTTLPTDTSIITTLPAPAVTGVQAAPTAYYSPSSGYSYSPGYFSVTYGWVGRSQVSYGCDNGWHGDGCGGGWHR